VPRPAAHLAILDVILEGTAVRVEPDLVGRAAVGTDDHPFGIGGFAVGGLVTGIRVEGIEFLGLVAQGAPSRSRGAGCTAAR
jgi:hypothetical protein